MKVFLTIAMILTSISATTNAAPATAGVGSIVKQITELNNERITKTTVRLTNQTSISGASTVAPGGGAQVLEFVVSLFDDNNGGQAYANETYLVVVDDGLNIQSIQKVRVTKVNGN